jgi:hypothetical protein
MTKLHLGKYIDTLCKMLSQPKHAAGEKLTSVHSLSVMRLGAIEAQSSDFGQNWEPGTGENLLVPRGHCARISQAIHTPLGL